MTERILSKQMRNIRLQIAYDGTRYDGWQRLGRESGCVTIQGKIEDVLNKMTGEEISLIGAGRTDAGVHAYAQTANFHTQSAMPCEQIRAYLNHYLPEDIGILDACETGPRFHSRYHAKEKKYLYRIVTGDTPCVFDHRYVYRFDREPDLQKMRKAAACLIGTHDFLGYTSLKKTKKSTVRTIYDITVYQEGSEIRLMFCGDGFLSHMVRILAGTLLDVGTGKCGPDVPRQVLAQKDRRLAGPTVPAKGLCLYEIRY